MEINTNIPTDSAPVYSSQVSTASRASNDTSTQATVQAATQAAAQVSVPKVSASEEAAKPPITKENLEPVSQALNKFFELMDANLQFSVHEKTQRIIVKMVDTKTNKVLKEFPPEEFLDTVARIRDCVGAILDKRV